MEQHNTSHAQTGPSIDPNDLSRVHVHFNMETAPASQQQNLFYHDPRHPQIPNNAAMNQHYPSGRPDQSYIHPSVKLEHDHQAGPSASYPIRTDQQPSMPYREPVYNDGRPFTFSANPQQEVRLPFPDQPQSTQSQYTPEASYAPYPSQMSSTGPSTMGGPSNGHAVSLSGSVDRLAHPAPESAEAMHQAIVASVPGKIRQNTAL